MLNFANGTSPSSPGGGTSVTQGFFGQQCSYGIVGVIALAEIVLEVGILQEIMFNYLGEHFSVEGWLGGV